MKLYSDEIAIQVLIQILKKNKIKKIIASPGVTNASLVASIQNDPFFEMYSCFDERSAAYMACGMAMESGEVVVLSCTGATASRNYLPGLTEAYHSKLPILAITSKQTSSREDNLSPQYINRTSVPKDAVRYSVQIPFVRGRVDTEDCILKINRAIAELYRGGGGPVHIDLTTNYTTNYVNDYIIDCPIIEHYYSWDKLPAIPEQIDKIAISIGTHKKMESELTSSIEKFCNKYGAVVLIDHSSRYYGKFGCHPTLLLSQEDYLNDEIIPELLIHIGEQSGDYYTYNWLHRCNKIWRISEDGIMRNTFGHLEKIFEMSERTFFDYYLKEKRNANKYYQKMWRNEIARVNKIPEMTFSNVWIANEISHDLPEESIIHLGVSNTLRAWSFFEFDKSITVYSNTGARGIDGAVSTLIGHSIANQNKICFGIFGDLTFFYDMNVLGNRHIGNNVRILLINNGGGAIFNLYYNYATSVIKNNIDDYIAACGHNGNKSTKLVKSLAENLGFQYLCANDKASFLKNKELFLSTQKVKKSIIFEVFLDQKNESEAQYIIRNILKYGHSSN